MKQLRNSSVEILRIVFMVLILVIHTYGHGSGLNYHWIYSLGTQPDTAWNLALFSLGQIGVTGFIFISGYFGIRLSAKSLCHLLGMVLFYAVLMGIMTKSFSLHYLISLLYPFNSWWFVSSYLVIMLVAPIVEKGISQISQKQFLLIMAGVIYYCYFMRFLTKAVGQDTLMLFTVYLFARYMRYYPSSIFCKICRLGGGISTLVIMLFPITTSVIGFHTDKVIGMFLQNYNILILLSASWVVLFCLNHPFYNKYINTLARGSLAIYLVTDFVPVRDYMDPILLKYLLKGYGLLIIVGICLLILLFDLVRSFVFTRVEQKIAAKLQQKIN